MALCKHLYQIADFDEFNEDPKRYGLPNHIHVDSSGYHNCWTKPHCLCGTISQHMDFNTWILIFFHQGITDPCVFMNSLIYTQKASIIPTGKQIWIREICQLQSCYQHPVKEESYWCFELFMEAYIIHISHIYAEWIYRFLTSAPFHIVGNMDNTKENTSQPDAFKASDNARALMYVERLFNICGIFTSFKQGSQSRCVLPLTFYQLFIFLLLIAHSVFTVLWFSEIKVEIFGSDTFRLVMWLLFNGVTLLIYLFLVRAFQKVPFFIEKIDSVKDDPSIDIKTLGKVLQMSPAQIGKWVAGGSVVVLFMILFQGFFTWNFVSIGGKEPIIFRYISQNDQHSKVVINILLVMTAYASGVWQSSVILLCLVTFILCRKFRSLNLRLRNLQKQLSEEVVDVDCNIFFSQERLNFESLLAALGVADNMFMPIISSSLFTVLFSFCLLIYNFIFDEMQPRDNRMLADFGLLSTYIQIFVVTLVNSLVLHKAVREKPKVN